MAKTAYMVNYTVTVERTVKVMAEDADEAKELAKVGGEVQEESDHDMTFDVTEVYEDEG